MTDKGTIIYLGRYEMPDKDATANRVLSNGKIFKELGYNVVFIGWNKSLVWKTEIDKKPVIYNGFDCWEFPVPHKKEEHFFLLKDAQRIKQIIDKYPNTKMLIAYNYPAIALSRINKLCKKRRIKCVADITEWYGSGSKGLLIQTIRTLDTFWRMRFVHKRLDGHIVISDYLWDYYSSVKIETIKLPPLVDLSLPKWYNKKKDKENSGKTTLVYAGSPCAKKERLDLLVRAIIKVGAFKLNVVGITKDEFLKMYPQKQHKDYNDIDNTVRFYGRINHIEALENVKNADYSVIIRENNRITKAGFPTKFVESISCGTPVITSKNSDVEDYIISGKNGYTVSLENLEQDLMIIKENMACIDFDRTLFDYKKYIKLTDRFLNNVLNNNI